MQTSIGRLARLHRYLAAHAVYATVLASALAVVLLAGRMFRSHSATYSFLVWNLFLAWIPYGCSLWAYRLHGRKARPGLWLLAPSLLWLAFFPNAPYLLTDIWHLQQRQAIPLWYDASLLSAFALAGLFLAIFSLRTMQRLVRAYGGAVASWGFVLLAVTLAGLGVYLGRFLRWNSWDLFLHPQQIAGDVLGPLLNPVAHPRAVAFTMLSAAILFVSYLAIHSRDYHEQV
jgi:uncharacterized membrane protein